MNRANRIVAERTNGSAWSVSLVDPAARSVRHRRVMEIAPDDFAQIENGRWAAEVIRCAGETAPIALLSDDHCPPFAGLPRTLASYPIEVSAVSHAAALAAAADKRPGRVIVIDFRAAGTLSFAKVDADGFIEDCICHRSDLRAMLGLPLATELVDAPDGESRAPHNGSARGIADAFRDYWVELGPTLGILRDFGADAIVVSSASFETDASVARFVEKSSEAPELAGMTVVAARPDDRYIGAARLLDTADRSGSGRVLVDPATRRIVVRTRRTTQYQVLEAREPLFSGGETTLTDILNGRPTFFVVDSNIAKLHGPKFHDFFGRLPNASGSFEFVGTEHNKRWETVERVCHAAAAARLRRDGVIVGIGGGVTLDVAGFAASIFRRGISFVRVPTTLVGMVDVAIGIKQGINFDGKKNLLGAFHPALASVNDARFLETLPAREISCGIAEIIKIAVVRDADLFALLEEQGSRLLASRFGSPRFAAVEVLHRAQVAMAEELYPNLYETELRRAVDFGHSLSPTFEAVTDYELGHGEAVAIEMLIATGIAIRRGHCDWSLLPAMLRLYHQVGLPLRHPKCGVATCADALREVRMHRAGALNFVVPRGIGSTMLLQDVSPHEIGASIGDIEHFARAY
jgi:2-epi-5-epi-valiolone synthase